MEAELKDLMNELHSVHEEFKRVNNEGDAERKKFGDILGETKERLEKMNDRMDEVEKKFARAQLPLGGRGDEESKSSPQKDAFLQYCRKGEGGLTPEQRKALSESIDPDGGYTVVPQLQAGIIKPMKDMSPVRELARVASITTNVLEILRRTTTAFGRGWVAEMGARTATTTGTLQKLSIPVHEIYSFPQATQSLLEDSSESIESWITQEVSEDFAVEEATAFIAGNGIGKPLGLLDSSTAITQVNSGSASLLTADGLINLVYALPELYANRATMLIRRASIRDIRKFKLGTGEYLWQPGLAGTNPATILDVPYREAADMPAIDTNALAVIVGDFNFYQIVDRSQILMTRDALTNKPYVGFYFTKRVGGMCLLPEAFRIQKCAV